MLTKKQLLDLQFIEGRARLLDVAAFLDRVDRHEGESDLRMTYYQKALDAMMSAKSQRARAVLEALSDESDLLPETAPFQGASGAPAQ